MAFLDTGAKYKDNFMRNFYTMGTDAVEKGKNEPPYAYIVPADQHDPNTAAKMINILIKQGAEVHVADEAFTAGNIGYPQGSYVLLMAQPFRPFVKDIMEKQVYPDLRRFPGGPPIPPYDVAGYTLPLLMGVKRVAVATPFETPLRRIDEAKPPAGTVQSRAGHAYILGHESNDNLIAVNRLLAAGHDVYWSEQPVSVGSRKFAAGAMVIPVKAGIHSEMASIAEDLSLQVYATNSAVSGSGYKLTPLRLALYNPWGGNMDEGWCKWLFDQYEFPYTEVRNAEIRAGDLKNRYDVIVFADQNEESIIDGIPEGSIPPQYAGGIGQEGVANLGTFVKAGGTLVTLSSASALPIKAFGLPVVNTLEEMSDEEFFCPGSILSIEVDTDHPVGYGMERKAAGFFSRSLAFEILPTFQDGGARAVAKYSGQNTLMSGWILGEEHLHNKVAVAEVSYGDGKVILFGFRVQNRAQPHGTFKLLFNALYYRAGGATRLP
jgi:hypothetical protein